MFDSKKFSNAVKNVVLYCVEKQKPKRALKDEYDVMCICPVCKSQMIIGANYCCECGQKIDWYEW